MDAPVENPREDDSASASAPWNADLNQPKRDRSYLVIGAWAFGLLIVVALIFRMGGGEPEVATPPPGVPGATGQLDSPVGAKAGASAPIAPNPVPVASFDSATQRSQQSPAIAARSAVSVSRDAEASYTTRTREHLVGAVNNGSDLTITSWKATVTFFDASNTPLGSASAGSTKPIAPGGRQSFAVDHAHLDGTVRARMVLKDVQFKK